MWRVVVAGWGGGGSICLLPLLIGTSASETATDAEAQREGRRETESACPARLPRGDSPPWFF